MTAPHQKRKVPIPAIAIAAVLSLAIGGTLVWLPRRSPSPQNASGEVETRSPHAYWIEDTESGLKLVADAQAAAKDAANPEQALREAFARLLSQNVPVPYSSAIPTDTQLLALSVDESGVRIDLSAEFGFGGGSASMKARLGQAIFTATSIDPLTPVWISLEGKPLEILGGEGLLVEQPETRASFRKRFPL